MVAATAGMALAASPDFSVQALSPLPTLQNGFQRAESLPISRVQKDPNFSVFNVAFGLIGVGLIQPYKPQSLHSSAQNLRGRCGEKSTVLRALPVK